MPTQTKHGRYEKFDISKASWVCPACKKDTMILNPVDGKYTFICAACNFDSKDYAISMTDKSSFNEVQKWLMREWPWINYVTKKWAVIGMEMLKAEYIKKEINSDEEMTCDGNCAGCHC